MSRGKVRQLKNLLREANTVIDIIDQRNKDLSNRILELEKSCENFVEGEENLHKKIGKLSKNKPHSIRQVLKCIFS